MAFANIVVFKSRPNHSGIHRNIELGVRGDSTYSFSPFSRWSSLNLDLVGSAENEWLAMKFHFTSAGGGPGSCWLQKWRDTWTVIQGFVAFQIPFGHSKDPRTLAGSIPGGLPNFCKLGNSENLPMGPVGPYLGPYLAALSVWASALWDPCDGPEGPAAAWMNRCFYFHWFCSTAVHVCMHPTILWMLSYQNIKNRSHEPHKLDCWYSLIEIWRKEAMNLTS